MESVVELYYQPLFAFAARLYGRPEAALRSTRRAFERVLCESSRAREPRQLKQWLFTALFSDFLRERRRGQIARRIRAGRPAWP